MLTNGQFGNNPTKFRVLLGAGRQPLTQKPTALFIRFKDSHGRLITGGLDAKGAEGHGTRRNGRALDVV
jgi:hypothetical protein